MSAAANSKVKPKGKPNRWEKGIPSPNPKGRPKDGQSWAGVLSEVSNMYADDLIQMVGESNDLGRALMKMPKNVQMKYLVSARVLAALMFEPTAGLWNGLMDRVDGKVPLQLLGNGSSEKDDKPFVLPADVIAPSFLDAYRDIARRGHTEYIFSGGRGSTKSSFVSLAIIYLIKNNPTTHGLVTRQVANTLRDSVFSQLQWAISELGLSDEFKCTTSPLEIEYLPTGQKIYFRGADDPGKIKSIKPTFGYIGVLWFEELDQFHGQEAIRKIEQSVIRGGDESFIFKSFNPPQTANNWANKYIQIPKATQYQHKSSYVTVPVEWLGKTFLDEAEHLKNVNPKAYDHEYLGIVNGTGGQIFGNVTIRKITDDEIYGIEENGRRVGGFDHILHGLDWGFYPDPNHYSRVHYDAARLTLYIFGEVRKWKTSNRDMHAAIIEYGYENGDLLIADSAEPKSVADFREYGASCRGAEKGKDSVKYSMKWLQSLKEIVIDNERAPFSAEEFLDYQFEMTKDGELISAYPDKNNHGIDSVRYATNLVWKQRGQ